MPKPRKIELEPPVAPSQRVNFTIFFLFLSLCFIITSLTPISPWHMQQWSIAGIAGLNIELGMYSTKFDLTCNTAISSLFTDVKAPCTSVRNKLAGIVTTFQLAEWNCNLDVIPVLNFACSRWKTLYYCTILFLLGAAFTIILLLIVLVLAGELKTKVGRSKHDELRKYIFICSFVWLAVLFLTTVSYYITNTDIAQLVPGTLSIAVKPNDIFSASYGFVYIGGGILCAAAACVSANSIPDRRKYWNDRGFELEEDLEDENQPLVRKSAANYGL